MINILGYITSCEERIDRVESGQMRGRSPGGWEEGRWDGERLEMEKKRESSRGGRVQGATTWLTIAARMYIYIYICIYIYTSCRRRAASRDSQKFV